MKKKRNRGLNEIKINLLPEKEKRDYVLRLGSLLIIMIFIIINFITVYIPRSDLIKKINAMNANYHNLLTEYNSVKEQFDLIDSKIYNMPLNTEAKKIENNRIDITSILKKYDEIKPSHSYIESISYNEDRYEILITVQFDTYSDLTMYQENLQKIPYVQSVKVGNFIPVTVSDGTSRVRTSYLMVLDKDKMPKVKVGVY